MHFLNVEQLVKSIKYELWKIMKWKVINLANFTKIHCFEKWKLNSSNNPIMQIIGLPDLTLQIVKLKRVWARTIICCIYSAMHKFTEFVCRLHFLTSCKKPWLKWKSSSLFHIIILSVKIERNNDRRLRKKANYFIFRKAWQNHRSQDPATDHAYSHRPQKGSAQVHYSWFFWSLK